jgi:hypothetical protein
MPGLEVHRHSLSVSARDESGRALHDGEVIDPLPSGGSFHRGHEPMENATEFGTFGGCHVGEVQKVTSCLDDDRSSTG